MVEAQLRQAAESLSLLRMQALAADPENRDLRHAFRETSYLLERVVKHKPVSGDAFRQLTAWLSMFLDADFGAQLPHCDDLDSREREALDAHVRERRRLLQQAEHDLPELHSALDNCLLTLNTDIRPDHDLAKESRLLARTLQNHLQDEARLRKSMHDLIEAMQQSLEQISDALGEIGGEIPELAATQDLLEMELPGDPKAAYELLQKARDSIVGAGQRVGRAGKAISQALESQQAQIQSMSENLGKAEFEAQHDPLTGLGNRRKLSDFFKALGDGPASFLIIDLDHFKAINDRYGHDAGDEVLAATAHILADNVRATDLVVRLGGEEFAAVLPDADAGQALSVAEKLRGAIADGDIRCSQGTIHVTASIGLSSRGTDEAVDHWIGRGDKALYEAKRNGRNRIEVSTG